MAHDGLETAVDDRLASCELDRTGGECVRSEGGEDDRYPMVIVPSSASETTRGTCGQPKRLSRPGAREDKLAYILGRDVSGLVAAVGAEVTSFLGGEELYAVPGIDRGGYAECVVVKENEAARKLSSLDHIAAAAVPLAALTAWQGLFHYGQLEAGQRILIHAGSDGVGHFAVQFARAKNARVATTVSAENADFARELGADDVIDYKSQRFEEVLRDVDMDLVFDLLNGETRERSRSVLKKGVILVSALTPPSDEAAAVHGVRATRYTVEESGEALAEIAQMIDAGLVKPAISKTFPLAKAA